MCVPSTPRCSTPLQGHLPQPSAGRRPAGEASARRRPAGKGSTRRRAGTTAKTKKAWPRAVPGVPASLPPAVPGVPLSLPRAVPLQGYLPPTVLTIATTRRASPVPASLPPAVPLQGPLPPAGAGLRQAASPSLSRPPTSTPAPVSLPQVRDPTPYRESVLYWPPAGPNPRYHLDDFSRPALRHGSLPCSQYLPS